MFKQTLMSITAAAFAIAAAQPTTGLADEVVRYQTVTTEDMVMPDPLPPEDIYRPNGSTPPLHKDLATFAWLEFIALNALAGDERGVPGGSFADSGFDEDSLLVWETYQHRSELFPFGDGMAVPPQPWDQDPKYVFEVSGVTYITPPERTRFNNLDESSQIGQNSLFFPDYSDDGLAQVLFQAKVNKIESDFVRQMVKDSSHTLGIDPDTNQLLVSPGPIDLPDNVIEVKTAWLPLTAIDPAQRYRYHQSEVTIYLDSDDPSDPTPVAKTEMRALIGIHIIQKTPNYPTFIFATFEHTDILKDPYTRESTGVSYIPTYDEIAYEVPATTDLKATDQTVTNPVILFSVDSPMAYPNGKKTDLPLGSVATIPGAAELSNGQYVVPVVQPKTTNSDIDYVNRKVLKAMSNIPGFDHEFVWQYYELKGVQSVPTSDDSVDDFYLANIVIESSQPGIQLFRGNNATSTTDGVTTFTNLRNASNVIDPKQNGAAFSVGGCQGCHGVAQTQPGFDFSFLFFGMGGAGFSPDTIGVKTQEEMLEQLQNYSLIQPHP